MDHTEQKGYIDNQDQAIKQIIADLRNYVNQQDSNINVSINNLKSYVDTQDNARNFYFTGLINQQGVSLQQLDSYYKYLLQSIANIAIEKGWDSSFVVHKGKTQFEINEFQNNIQLNGCLPNGEDISNAFITFANSLKER